MADSQKNNTLLVVVVVVLAFCTVPTFCFTEDLQHYTNEIAKRSFGISNFLNQDSALWRTASALYKLTTFFVAFESLALLLEEFPFIGAAIKSIGFPLFSKLQGTEMMTARDGEDRDQRLIDYADEQVKAAVHIGQHLYENHHQKK